MTYNFSYEHALITARINTSSTPKLNGVLRQIDEMIKDDREIEHVGGIALIFIPALCLVLKPKFLEPKRK